MTIGNATADDLTITASLASNIPIKTQTTYNVGSSTIGLQSVYIGGTSTFTTRLMSNATASYTITFPTTVGVAGQSLVNSGSGTLAWGPGQRDITAKSADYVVLDNDGNLTIAMTTGGTDRTITLPTAADNTNRTLIIRKVDGLDSDGTGKLTVAGEGAELINGSNTQLLFSADDHMHIQCDGTGWHILRMRQTEYLYNTTTTDADNTTSFGYGPTGSQFGNFTSGRTKRVGTLAAITASDQIIFELTTDSEVSWWDLTSQGDTICPYTTESATEYGVLVSSVSSTSINVAFMVWRRKNGATFGANGANYTAIDAAATHKWRIKKLRII